MKTLTTLTLVLTALFLFTKLNAQTQTYTLTAIAEGNFGTPNGDAFRVQLTPTGSVVSGALYQTANTTTGFDVLQDFEIAGNKAILLSKGASSYRIVIAAYPSFNHLITFTNIGAPQCVGKASNTKAYVSVSGSIAELNLVTLTKTNVADPSAFITAYSDYMIGAEGALYAAIGSKLVKIDTLQNKAIASLNPGVGSITGLQYDAVNKHLWVLGKVNNISSVARIDVANNDFINTPLPFTGIGNARHLRYASGKLYFLSGKNVHYYTISQQQTTPAVYTSSLSGSWDFAYGKAFYVEAQTGNLVIGSANAFTGPSLYEIVNGTTYQLDYSGNIPGCKGVNEFFLQSAPLTANLSGYQAPQETELTIYPNPASDYLVIKNNTSEYYHLELCTPNATPALHFNITERQITIPVNDLPEGIWFLKITNQNGSQNTKKLIINRR